MKNIIEFLKKNGIEYQEVTYGNPYYYNDEFSVPAIRVTFDYELADDYKELKRKEHIFLQSMKQQEHEERIQKDIEKFLTRRTRM